VSYPGKPWRAPAATMRKSLLPLWQANAALREALFGNAEMPARMLPRQWRSPQGSHEAEEQAALAYALASDAAHAQSLADDLAKRLPAGYRCPVSLASLPSCADRNGPQECCTEHRASSCGSTYELGMLSTSAANSCLYPVYVRAEAHLSAQQGQLAAAEFQKNPRPSRAVMELCDWCPGAAGRGSCERAASRKTRKARMPTPRVRALAAYKDFFTLWKDADPDIPILISAKAEYAKLQIAGFSGANSFHEKAGPESRRFLFFLSVDPNLIH